MLYEWIDLQHHSWDVDTNNSLIDCGNLRPTGKETGLESQIQKATTFRF